MEDYGMPGYLGNVRGMAWYLAPDGKGGGTPRKGAAPKGTRPSKGTPAKGAKPAKQAAPPAKAVGGDDDDDEDTDEDEDEDIDEDIEEETDEDIDEDDDEEDEEEEEDEEKPARGVKPKAPKKVKVSAQELKELREKAQASEQSERARAKAQERAAREREDRIAAKDGVKALERARKRLQRDIDSRDEEINTLRDRENALTGKLAAVALSSGLRDAIDSVLEERGQKLRKGALSHIREAIRGRFDVTDDDEDESGVLIVHKETNQTLQDFLTEAFDTDEYELFLEDVDTKAKAAREERTPRTPVQGTHKPTGNGKGGKGGKDEPGKKLSYAASYKERVKEAEEAMGVKSAIGIRPQPKKE